MSDSLGDAVRLRNSLAGGETYPEIGEQRRLLAHVRKQLDDGVDPAEMPGLADDLDRAEIYNGVVAERVRRVWGVGE
jgi:hypothetical protein